MNNLNYDFAKQILNEIELEIIKNTNKYRVYDCLQKLPGIISLKKYKADIIQFIGNFLKFDSIYSTLTKCKERTELEETWISILTIFIVEFDQRKNLPSMFEDFDTWIKWSINQNRAIT